MSKSLVVVSLSFLLTLASTAARAETCVQNVCIGNGVIDGSNRVSQVIGIRAGEKLEYRDEYGNTHVDSPLNLSVEVPEHDGIAPGVGVIDESNRVSTALHVYQDGRGQYRDVYGNRHVSRSLVPAVSSFGSLRQGRHLVDESNRVGTIDVVYRDGRAAYKDVYGNAHVSSNVSAEADEKNGIRAGIKAIDESNRVSTVSHAFEDGRASYVDQYGNSHVSSQLEPSVPSLGNLASGHHAVDESNRLATVTYTFRDGRASYTDEYGNGHVSRALSAETGHASADADVKRDATIIDASNRIGRVAYVFEDDRVRYADAYGNNHVDGSKSLSVEVETNPKYDKKLAYATEGYSVGTPKRFFKDGRIELVMLGGGGRVETRLYSQVNELSGYAAGTLVAESTGLSGRVTMVFENGTVAAEYKYSYEDKELAATIAAKIFGFDPARIAQDEATWIHLLEQRVLAEKNKWYRFNGPRGLLTAVESGLPALKAQLAARLAREPRLVRSDENRSAVLAILGAATPTPAPGAGEPTKPVTKPGRRGD